MFVQIIFFLLYVVCSFVVVMHIFFLFEQTNKLVFRAMQLFFLLECKQMQKNCAYNCNYLAVINSFRFILCIDLRHYECLAKSYYRDYFVKVEKKMCRLVNVYRYKKYKNLQPRNKS